MAKLRNFNSNEFLNKVERRLTQDTARVMRHTGVEVAKKAMIETIKQNIYKRYTPVQYHRRMNDNGLIDPENIVTQVYTEYIAAIRTQSVQFSVGNKAKRTIITKKQNQNGFRSRKITKKYYNSAGELVNDNATLDLLYLWKDKGLVYDMFGSPNFHKYAKPAHLNDDLDKRITKSVKSGVISRALLSEYQNSFPNSVISRR